MENRFDLVVIGGGPGGYTAAIRALQLGLKVAVVEEREMGGTCLNRGCIPTKALLQSAEVYHTARHSSDFGISIEKAEFNYSLISKRKDTIVKQLRSGISALVKSNNGTVLTGKAFIIDKNTIEVTADEKLILKAEKIILATGSRPLMPSIQGIDSDRVLDSDAVLEMKECPEKIVIIGGGVIGVEFATLFNMLGKQVTIIEMMNTIIPGVDSEISGMLRKSLESKGVVIFTGSKVTSISSGKTAACIFDKDGRVQKAEADIVIAAIGRRPNTENLGLEKLGVAFEKGFVKVNENMETSVKGIYAIGDVTGKVLLAHVASAQGLIAAINAVGGSDRMNYSAVPSCIYTSPEIAWAGMTEEDAVRNNIKYKAGRFPVSFNGKSMIAGEREGMAKIISDASTGEILGAHLMAPRATDMIGEICVAMKLESTIEELSHTIHPHPTVSEIIMEAAHDAERRCVHKPGR